MQVARQTTPLGGHGHALGLGAQPRALNRQRGLVAEGDGQFHLFAGELARLTVVEGDRAVDIVFDQKRHNEQGLITAE